MVEPTVKVQAVGIEESGGDGGSGHKGEADEEAVGGAAFVADGFDSAEAEVGEEDAEAGEEAAVRVRPEHEQGWSEPEEFQAGQIVVEGCLVGCVVILCSLEWKRAELPLAVPAGEAVGKQGEEQREADVGNELRAEAPVVAESDGDEEGKGAGGDEAGPVAAGAEEDGADDCEAEQAFGDEEAGAAGEVVDERESVFGDQLVINPGVALSDVRIGRGRRQAVGERVAAVLDVTPEIGIGDVERESDGAGEEDGDERAAVEPAVEIGVTIQFKE